MCGELPILPPIGIAPDTPSPPPAKSKAPSNNKNVWPYNLFSGQGEAHPGRK